MSVTVSARQSHSTTFKRQNIIAVPTSGNKCIDMANDKRTKNSTISVPSSPRLNNNPSTTQHRCQQFHYSQIPPTISLPSISSKSTCSSDRTSKQRSVPSPRVRLQSINDVDSEEKTDQKLCAVTNFSRLLNRPQLQQSNHLSSQTRTRVSSAPVGNSLQQPSSVVVRKPRSANESIQQQKSNLSHKGSGTTLNHSRRKNSTMKTNYNNQQLNTNHRYRLVKVDKKQYQVKLSQQSHSKVLDAAQKHRTLVLVRTKPTKNIFTNEHHSLPQCDRKDNLLAVSKTNNSSSNILKQSIHSPDFRLHLEQKNISLVRQPLMMVNTTLQQSSSSSSSSSSIGSQLSPQNQLVDQNQDIDSGERFNFVSSKPEVIDSNGIKAILIDINKFDDDKRFSSLSKTTSKTDSQTRSSAYRKTNYSDLTKFEYVVANSFDNTTTPFKISPRSSSQNRDEMGFSSNSKAPQLESSIVADSVNQSDNLGYTSILRTNTTTTERQHLLDDVDTLEHDDDENSKDEQIALCYDEILDCFYDPETKIYYELQST
ncbi:unnamed protein product [Didymodactylos carnosus]|uniref:Uncharacterized protein n=1 Tax=Didymodactylos carnosus TaxID=1234261 RepID=A0A814Z2I2_9BILA|nr:unnamed protein product [Didymodactylos carnosus]CAF1309210.1 unnamed protein product [Didymodactylos carnosus]CAF4001395.1 unnamed protein product [Didymodactylos carnosus]CAF4116747.1 unnamed protein product [Didymodactylos carnosus]